MPLDYSRWDKVEAVSDSDCEEVFRKEVNAEVNDTSKDQLRRSPCQHCGNWCALAHLKQCSQCKQARYCSRACQVAAWGRHKNECQSAHPSCEKPAGGSIGPTFEGAVEAGVELQRGSSIVANAELRQSCLHCGSLQKQSDLKKCSRCLWARYCSKDCQKAGWKNHKSKCQPLSATDSHVNMLRTVGELVRLLPHFVDKPIFTNSANDGCTSLLRIAKHALDQHGDGMLVWRFKDVGECEDMTMAISNTLHRAKFMSGKWEVARVLECPVLGFGPIPSATSEDGLSKLLWKDPSFPLVLEQITDSTKPHFGLTVLISAKVGEPTTVAAQAVAIPLVDAYGLSDEKKPKMLRASESAYALARKLESESEFLECRELLFEIQRLAGCKGVFWLRQLSNQTNGYLVPELTQITPSALGKALRKELRQIGRSCSKGEHKFTVGVGKVEFCPLHGESLSYIRRFWPDIPTEKILSGRKLTCNGFFLTYHSEHSDLFTLTAFNLISGG